MVVAVASHFHTREAKKSLLLLVFSTIRRGATVKRWIIVLLVALALVLLLSPGLIGRLAEQNLDEHMSWVDAENDDIVIESKRFDRGWFTSEGRHRVSLTGSTIAELLAPDADAGRDDPPTLIIDTRMDHGLVPITSMTREKGSLQPAIASSVSTLALDRGDGEIVDVPGKVFSRIDLSGDATFRYLLEPGQQVSGNISTSWSGADLTIETAPRSRTFSVVGTIEPLTVESYGITTNIGKIAINAAQDRSRYTFGVGKLSLDVDSANVSSAGAVDAGFRRLVLNATSRLDGDRVNGATALNLDHLVVPEVGDVNVSIDVAVNGLDAEALEVIVAALRETNGGGAETDAGLLALYPSIETGLETLVANGGSIKVNELKIAFPQGDFFTAFSVDIPETDRGDDFSWPSVLLKLTASADIWMSSSLYDFFTALEPEAAGLLAMGIVRRVNDRYELKAEFKGGLLTVNGAPLPIPLAAPE